STSGFPRLRSHTFSAPYFARSTFPVSNIFRIQEEFSMLNAIFLLIATAHLLDCRRQRVHLAISADADTQAVRDNTRFPVPHQEAPREQPIVHGARGDSAGRNGENEVRLGGEHGESIVDQEL